MRPMGPISQMAMRGEAIPMPGLASIQKLTNGFVVSYDKAMEVIPPVRMVASMIPPELKKGFDQIARAAAGKIAGEEWKGDDDGPDAPDAPPKPVWVLESVQMLCRGEDELIAALRDAVKESSKIEVLYREGKLSGGGVGYATLGM
jgi:hypothetical protein